MPPSLPLIYRIRPPQDAAASPPLLLLLHGVGSHEGDLMGLAPYLDARFLIVSARGPVTLAPGMYAWFQVVLDPANPIINPEQAESSRRTIIRFIGEAVAAYHADPARVYLMGFSQGAIMSLSVALTEPSLVAGVVAMSGRLLPEVLPRLAPPDALRGLPILLQHGVADQVLPIQHGRTARDGLAALRVDLTYREYPIGHQVSDESLADAAAWLTEHLDRR
ncbi:MAG TPA: phospholipase, partial [bacterium]